MVNDFASVPFLFLSVAYFDTTSSICPLILSFCTFFAVPFLKNANTDAILDSSVAFPKSTKKSILIRISLCLVSIDVSLFIRVRSDIKVFGSLRFARSYSSFATVLFIYLIELIPFAITWRSLSYTYLSFEMPYRGGTIWIPYSSASALPFLISSSLLALFRYAVMNSAG